MATDGGGVAAGNASGIDAVLVEGLENPRDRLTILRLEEEVLRFIENSKQEQLELQSMVSSYARLAAHHVAEHYRMKSLLVDTREGPKIVLTKTGDTKVPSTRLRDVPVKPIPGILLPPLSPPKLAIKRRPTSGCFTPADVTNINRREVKLQSARSVEERKEEYNKARARIFSEDDSNPGRICCPRILKLDSNLLEEIKRDLVKAKEGGGEANKDGRSRENQSSTKVKPNHRVAIIRDREKDKRDPDYDRSYDRYHHPGEANSYGLGIVAPQVIYNTHFHQHVHVPPQAVQGVPWMNPMSYGPEATYTHQTILMQGPQVGGYHGSYAGEASQHYYQQFSQQPEVNHIQPRRF